MKSKFKKMQQGTAGLETTSRYAAVLFLVFFGLLSVGAAGALAEAEEETLAPGRTMARQALKKKKPKVFWNTTDHGKHEILSGEFKSGPEVTAACLSCHTEAAEQFHQTIHWTWLDSSDPKKEVGKGGLSVNNFCINVNSNEPRCTSCHAGYGWKGDDFDFSDPTKVDCLVCHEQTGTYKKYPPGAGHPVSETTVFKGNGKTYEPPDWNFVAQSVGRPTRKNCGTCHFSGGGGDGVKHGDLDSSLMKPNKNLDVHMGMDGQKFDCVRCHTTVQHRIAGRIYATPASKDRKSLIEDDMASKIMCESCHSATPHKKGEKPNDHTDKVACQSCHIPEYARVNPTKMWWDWSKAGKKKDGKPYEVKGEHGKDIYNTKKGEFRWGKERGAGIFLVQRLHTDTHGQGRHRSRRRRRGGEAHRRPRRSEFPDFPVQGASRKAALRQDQQEHPDTAPVRKGQVRLLERLRLEEIAGSGHGRPQV